MNKNLYKAFFLLITFTVLILSSTTLSASNQTCDESISSTYNANIKHVDVQKNTTTTTVNTNNKNNAGTKNNNTNKQSNTKNITTSEKQTNNNKSVTTTTKSIVKKDLRNGNITIKESGVMNIPLNKNKKIYFAMDHTNKNDRTICNNIVNTLKKNGFNVVRYTIGPNAMYNNMLYLYKHKITNAIMFHLFNGVDPSNIREVGTNGNDKRGRTVRSRGNDVVLAWFYDSSDCVNVGGSCYSSVRGSETGGRLYNPRNYMDNNKIRYICTSSDRGKHKSTADYNGIKTANAFIKLFSQNTITTVTHTSINKASLTLRGTVKGSASNSVSGNISLYDSNNNLLQQNIKVQEGNFNTTINLKKSGLQTIKVNFLENEKNHASNTVVNVNIPKNVTLNVNQIGNHVDNTYLYITALDDKSNQPEIDREIYVKTSNGKISIIKTNTQGTVTLAVNSTNDEYYEVYCTDYNNNILNSVKKLITVKKNDVTITVDPIISTIGEKVTLKATLKDQKGNPVNGGKVIFKLNDKKLKADKTFNDNNSTVLYINVKNGVASTKIISDLKLRDEKYITAAYIGNYKYNSNVSKAIRSKINKRNATVEVKTSKTMVNPYESVEFIVTLKDITPDSTNKALLHTNSYVAFKINGVLLNDSDGKMLLVKVGKDNTARYNYTIAPGTAGLTSKFNIKNYTLTAILMNDNYYCTAKNQTVYQVNRSSTKININKAVIENNILTIEANVKDFKDNYAKGNQKMYLKIDNKTYKENDTIKYFNVKNGIVRIQLSLENINISKISLIVINHIAYCSSGTKCTIKN